MSVAVCIASRGRPDEFLKTRDATLRLAVLPDTHVTVALDAGDVDYSVDGCRAPRENSLGAKYNRAASYANRDAHIFVVGIDDAYMAVEGWDQKLVEAAATFTDGVGVINLGTKLGAFQLPEGVAVTKRWIEQVGFFCPPYFPFWWHDTWIDEMARFTGRYVWAEIPWEHHGASEKAGAHKTTRMREVSWWANFFDATREMRMARATGMILASDSPKWLKSQLLSEMRATADILWQRNARVRDEGRVFERMSDADYATVDLGYEQIKAEAVAMMAGLGTRAA